MPKRYLNLKKMIPVIKPINADFDGRPIELEELQSMNPEKVISHKLDQLKNYKLNSNSIYIVEDTSFFCSALNGFPGPYIKDFIFTVGMSKFAEMCKGHAIIKTYIGSYHIKPNSETITKIFAGEQLCTVHNKTHHNHSTIDYDYVTSAIGSHNVFSEDQSTKTHRIDAIKKFYDNFRSQMSHNK